jgi:hypothetical protein
MNINSRKDLEKLQIHLDNCRGHSQHDAIDCAWCGEEESLHYVDLSSGHCSHCGVNTYEEIVTFFEEYKRMHREEAVGWV